MIEGSDDYAFARDIIEVNGQEAATVARENASAAALAGQSAQAKAWISVLGIIQRQQAGKRIYSMSVIASMEGDDGLA